MGDSISVAARDELSIEITSGSGATTTTSGVEEDPVDVEKPDLADHNIGADQTGSLSPEMHDGAGPAGPWQGHGRAMAGPWPGHPGHGRVMARPWLGHGPHNRSSQTGPEVGVCYATSRKAQRGTCIEKH